MRLAAKNQVGFTLIEVVISIALMGILAVALLGAMGAALNYFTLADERETAKNLGELKMEQVLNQTYSNDYSSLESVPIEYPGYTVDIPEPEEISTSNVTMQKVAVVVIRNSRTYRLEEYKVGR
jgi:prepilin-type N-terminal cleavage/methylation domain-containing protein